jgi:plastocyanin
VVTFDGGASSDENGIAFWWWRFSYAGAPRTLTGFSPSFTFDLVGSHVVQLEVVDPAGNTAVDLMAVVVLDIEDPVADPGPDVTIGPGMDVTLDGSRSRDNVGITSWTWSFTCMGEDHVLEGRVGEYKFDVPGAYPIHLMVHDAAGNSDEATLVVTVLDTMPPSIGPIEDVRASIGETVRFEGASASDNVGVESWRWSFHDGNRTVVLEGVEAHHAFSIEGNYSITLTVADKAGNTAERSFTVFVQGTPDGKDPVVRPHPYSDGGTTWPVVIILLMLLAIAVAVWVGRRGAKG